MNDTQASRSARILVADDEAATAERVANVLREAGFQSVEERSRISELRQLEGYDLVVLDIVWPARAMPTDLRTDTFGLTALHYLRKERPATLIILMSKYLFDLEELVGLRAADGFFKSGAESDQIVGLVENVLCDAAPEPASHATYRRDRALASPAARRIDNLAAILQLALHTERASWFALSEEARVAALGQLDRLRRSLRETDGDAEAVPLLEGLAATVARASNLRRTVAAMQRVAPLADELQDRAFISYSHHDRGWLERLTTVLEPYQLDAVWSDVEIRAGRPWREEIEAALAGCRVAVLLISADYLASAFVREHELPAILARFDAGTLEILWIPVSAAAVHKTRLADIQAVFDPATPLDGLTDSVRQRALVRICDRIELALEA